MKKDDGRPVTIAELGGRGTDEETVTTLSQTSWQAAWEPTDRVEEEEKETTTMTVNDHHIFKGTIVVSYYLQKIRQSPHLETIT
jgi:hypothetical protein